MYLSWMNIGVLSNFVKMYSQVSNYEYISDGLNDG